MLQSPDTDTPIRDKDEYGVHLPSGIKEKDGCYLVNNDEISLSPEKIFNKRVSKTIIDTKPQTIIRHNCLCNNNDRLKTNTALQMKDTGIEFKVM